MGQDKFSMERPSDKLARLRATRLSSYSRISADEESEKKEGEKNTFFEASPVTNAHAADSGVGQQVVPPFTTAQAEDVAISEKLLAVAPPSTGKSEKLRRFRLSSNTDAGVPAASSTPPDMHAGEVEKFQTLHLEAAEKAPEVIVSEEFAGRNSQDEVEVEKLSTVQAPSLTQAKEAALLQRAAMEVEAAEELEKLPTLQISATRREAETLASHPLEKLETLQMPAARANDEATTVMLPVQPSSGEKADGAPTTILPVFPSSRERVPEPGQTLPISMLSAASSEVVDAATTVMLPVNSRFAFVRRLMRTVLRRLQEPQPEGPVTRGLQIVNFSIGLGLFPLVTLTNALGLLLVSIADYLPTEKYTQEFAFLLGLLLIFVPNLLRLLSPATLRLERMCLLCGLALAFYLVGVMGEPLHFSSFDEFLHWGTANALVTTGHLFSDNSMLPVSPYYPGLEIVTNAISTITGLSTFYASIPIIISSRLLTVFALFLFYEQITSSSRMAGIATVIYMVNPHFIFFDSIYSYETLALPLAICAFYILARYERIGGKNRWIIFTSWLLLIALTVTHHMTDYVFDGLLLLWAAVSFFAAASRKVRIHLTSMAVFGIVLALAYAFLVNGNPVWSYLSSYFSVAFVELGRIITGTGASRPLFAGTGGTPSPIWDRIFMTGSVAIVAFALPFGLLTLWRLHRRNALPLMLGVFALAYPVAQAFRFTTLGPEIADRSSAFLFLAVAYVLTLLLTHFWPTRGLNKRSIALMSCAISVMFLGGVILDLGPGYIGLPGPYIVGAGGRSIEAEGINAALWTSVYLGPDNRIGTDRINQMLMSTYGEQRVVTELDDQIDVSPVFYSALFGTAEIGLLHAGKVHYLVVDMRLSTAVPAAGFYFVSDEPEANHITTPISREALAKFSTVSQINRLFDSGNIVIYDTGAFLSG